MVINSPCASCADFLMLTNLALEASLTICSKRSSMTEPYAATQIDKRDTRNVDTPLPRQFDADYHLHYRWCSRY